MASRRTLKPQLAAHEQASLAQISPTIVPVPMPAEQPPISIQALELGDPLEVRVEELELDDGRIIKVERAYRGRRLVSQREVK